MSGLTPKARALLDRTARGHDPTEDDRARVRARVARKIAIGAAAAGAASAASKTLTAGAATGGTTTAVAGIGGLLAKAVVSIAIVGTVSVGATQWASKPEPLPVRVVASATASAPPARTRVTPVEKESVESLERDESVLVLGGSAAPNPREMPPPPPRTVTVPVLKRAAPAATAATTPAVTAAPIEPSAPPAAVAEPVNPLALSDEVDLLARAHEALGRNDGPLALTLLEGHARRFPRSALAEERAAVRVFALCSSGRALEAAREGAEFLAKHPRSPLAERVRGSCATP